MRQLPLMLDHVNTSTTTARTTAEEGRSVMWWCRAWRPRDRLDCGFGVLLAGVTGPRAGYQDTLIS
jgi:hypothetical protein